MGDLTAPIESVLCDVTSLTAPEIASTIGTDGDRTVWDIYQALFTSPDRFCRDEADPPGWSLAPILDRPLDSGLYAWQREALTNWERARGRGIVEAVTGAGKTRIALEAADSITRRGGRVLIIVPTIDLVRQWSKRCEEHLPGRRVGTHAAGKKDRLESKDVLVVTRNSAHKLQLNGDHSRNLLVADEVHGLGAPTFRKGLSHAFGYRLGLTATLERSDDGVKQVILPYFESKVFTLGYQRARAEGAIAPFDIAMIPVRLGRAAQNEYNDLSTQISDTRRLLIRRYGLPAEPYEEFMAELGRAADDDTHPGSWAARKYHKAVNERLDLVGASSPQKRHVLNKLVPALDAANRALVFTLFIKDADSISDQLVERGVRSESVHSNGDRDERQRILDRFERGKTQTLVATKVLDEGVDVPEADLGVVMAAFRTRRTMIQRLGRVLRPKADGRAARFAIVYTVDTIEDPANGSHEDFLTDVRSAARRLRVFDLRSSPGAWLSFLRGDDTPGGDDPPAATTALPPSGPSSSDGQARSRGANELEPTGSEPPLRDRGVSISSGRIGRATEAPPKKGGTKKKKKKKKKTANARRVTRQARVAERLNWSPTKVDEIHRRWKAAGRRVDKMGSMSPDAVLMWLRAEKAEGNPGLLEGAQWEPRSDR